MRCPREENWYKAYDGKVSEGGRGSCIRHFRCDIHSGGRYNGVAMKIDKRNYALSGILLAIGCAWLLFGGLTTEVCAQDDPDEVESLTEQTEMPASEPSEEAGDTTPPAESSEEGLVQGAYWWAEPEDTSIAALLDFGLDVVAFRLGRVDYMSPDADRTRESPGGLMGFAWADGGDVEALDDLPLGLEYRPVVEIKQSFMCSNEFVTLLRNFFDYQMLSHLSQEPSSIRRFEIRLVDSEGSPLVVEPIANIISGLKGSGEDIQIELGIDASVIVQTSSEDMEVLASAVDGLVVYFLDYDLTGPAPRITDRAWIDSTCALLQSYGMPFTAVVPVYNRALLYREGESTPSMVLPAVDIEMLLEISDVREMGSAGTEYTIIEAETVPDVPIGVGDRVRILESLSEIDLDELMQELPEVAPLCREIDLFRFPLIPGFDPEANTALTAAGFIASPVSQADDPDEAERRELDSKYNKMNQYIWMFALAMMLVMMMRIFRKTREDGGEGKGGSK